MRAQLINYTKTGGEFWIEIDLMPIADAKGLHTHWIAIERDITHRKLAEQALFESQQRYSVLFDTAPVPMWVFDAETCKFLAVNEALVTAFGYSRDELLGMTIFDVRSSEEAELLKVELQNGLKPLSRHRLLRCKDGSEVWVDNLRQSISYEGRAAYFVVSVNVSSQVKAEKEVQHYLSMLQRSADAAQAITWHQNLDAMLNEVASQARGVLGAHQAGVSLTLGEGWDHAINAQSLSDKYASYRGLSEPRFGAGVYAVVCEDSRVVRLTQAEIESHPRWQGLRNCDDKHLPMRGWLAVPLKGRTGKNIGLLQLSDKYEGDFTLQDEYVAIELAQLAAIAIENAQLLAQVNQLNAGLEQKVAERTAALSRQEALFRALAEQAPQVIWTADPAGNVTYANRAWFDLVGGTLKDWTGTAWMSAVHPEDRRESKENWALATESMSSYQGIRRMLGGDGLYHTMSYKASPVIAEDGTVSFWVGIDADITELKNIETALRLSNQELEAFSYSVSHDLRSPLNTIDGFSQLLSKQLSVESGSKAAHYLARIQAGVAQMGKLIEGLLALAQVSRTPLRYEVIDLSALAKSILEDRQRFNTERVARFEIHPQMQAQGDARLIRALMENLLGNAWKFTSKTSETLIEVGQQIAVSGLPVFFVKDNGAGFDMSYADKLFVAFQRLHTASEFPGTGIGLATAGRIVSRHGGKLWAEGSPEQGAMFFFTLPNYAAAPESNQPNP